ncbi:MAG: 30S ribosomal protein S20 [Simkaniaceae bacterium]|nr:30S ribosomal protein S20 [Simkaniaceae bacterium]
MANEKNGKKQKRPTALKRKIQSDKKNLLNKSFKSRIKTSLKALKAYVQSGDKEKLPQELNRINSLIDKGVKNNIVKKNKANRVKSSAAKLIKTV